jgi:hypothetical protein
VREVDAAHAGVLSRWQVPSTFDTAPLEALEAGGYAPAFENLAHVVEVKGIDEM